MNGVDQTRRRPFPLGTILGASMKVGVKTAFGIALNASLLVSSSVYADGRSVAYLQGVAFGVAANCPKLHLDTKAIALSKRGIPGLRQGNPTEFAAGAFQFHELLNSMTERACDAGPCTCENVCGFRPGTCYFVKEPEEGEPK
jgi:hypothetical protein